MPTLNTATKRRPATVETLQAENKELRFRLQEAEETLEAIRTGAVDAVMVEGASGARVYTLAGADRPYRLFVEEMEQGAATLHADGTIAWCNRRLGHLLKMPPEKLTGALLRDFISPDSLPDFDKLLWQGQTRSGRAEAQLRRADGHTVPAFFTFNALPGDCGSAIGVLVTDLTPQQHHEQLKSAHAARRESQRQLALVADTAPVFIAHCDREARYKFVNERYAARFGLKPEDCRGKRIADVLGAVAFESIRPYVDIVLSGQPVEFELELPYAVFGNHFMHCSYAPELDANGMVVGFVGAIIDITERRQAEEALRESERRFRQMIDALPAAIYTTDAEGRLTHFNPAAVEFSGRTPELGTDRWCVSFKLYYPDGRPMPHAECPMAITLKEGRVVRGVEAITERPDGRRVWFTPYPTPLRDSAGKIVGGINMLLDITERKRGEEARARLAAIVESSDDAIVAKDLNGVIISWNAGAERLFGYKGPEVIGRPVALLIPPERRDEEPGILERIRRESASDITRQFADARMAHCSMFR